MVFPRVHYKKLSAVFVLMPVFPSALAAGQLQSMGTGLHGSLLLPSVLRAQVLINRDHPRGKKVASLSSDPEDEGTLNSFPEPDPCGYEGRKNKSEDKAALQKALLQIPRTLGGWGGKRHVSKSF